MWIVVVVDAFYPSVLHFNNKEEAVESYEKNKEQGYVTHLAETIMSHYEEESLPSRVGESKSIGHFQKNVEELDVEWHGVYR